MYIIILKCYHINFDSPINFSTKFFIFILSCIAIIRVCFSGQHVIVEIEYETSPSARALQWLTLKQTAGKKHPYIFSQCQVPPRLVMHVCVKMCGSGAVCLKYHQENSLLEIPSRLPNCHWAILHYKPLCYYKKIFYQEFRTISQPT